MSIKIGRQRDARTFVFKTEIKTNTVSRTNNISKITTSLSALDEIFKLFAFIHA